MKYKLKTIEYFKSCVLTPIEIRKIFDDPLHEQYNNLIFDLNHIDKSSLEEYVNKYNIDWYLGRFKDKEQGRRIFYLHNLLSKEIAKERISVLLDKSPRPKPYNSDNLKKVKITKDNLVNIKEFNIDDFGYKYNNFVYELTPVITNQLNSSHWISRSIMEFTKKKGLNFKIRLDPFIKKKESEYKPMVYKWYIYGKPLDWEKLKKLTQDDSGRFFDGKSDSEVEFTDYVWRPVEENELHFTCEEMPKNNCIDYRGSRFFHAIFDKTTGNIKHCDGAIRFYSKEELENRKKYHVKEPEIRKVGKRIKIFQIDDTIDQNTFSTLVVTYFVWNDDIKDYFGGK